MKSRKLLIQHEIDQLEWLINFIGNESSDDQVEVFSNIVDKAIRYGVQSDDLSDKFGVNRSTVSRWRSMKSAPQYYMRPLVLKEISRLLKALSKTKKSELKLISSDN